MTATLRIWVDHPFNARFLEGTSSVSDKMVTADRCAGILANLARDGWVAEFGEYDQNGGQEVLWVAHKMFDSTQDAVAECVRNNPQRWGTLIDDEEEVLW